LLALVLGGSGVFGCGNPVDGEALAKAASRSEREAEGPQPEAVKPPFDVSGEAEGLLLVWYDQEGLHTATKRSEIPEARRAQVRVDSLKVAPDARLDSDLVYVADLRQPAGGGQYAVRKAPRSWFDAQVDREKPAPPAAAESDVVIYMASWCGACRGAAEYLRGRQVPFVEKDVEKDPGAAAEMQRKTSAKGLTPRGVPVIDFRGDIMLGFDQQRLGSLIAASGGGKAI
jgi:glutaredoxin